MASKKNIQELLKARDKKIEQLHKINEWIKEKIDDTQVEPLYTLPCDANGWKDKNISLQLMLVNGDMFSLECNEKKWDGTLVTRVYSSPESFLRFLTACITLYKEYESCIVKEKKKAGLRAKKRKIQKQIDSIA